MSIEEQVKQSLERQARSVRITGPSHGYIRARVRSRSRRARVVQPFIALLVLAVFAGALTLVRSAFQPGHRRGAGNANVGASSSPIPLGLGATYTVEGDGRAIAAGGGTVSASVGTSLVGVDPADGHLSRLPFAQAPTDITYAGGSLWAAGFEKSVGSVVKRIDPTTGTVQGQIPFLTGTGVSLIVGDDEGVWVVVAEKPGSFSLARIDLATNTVVAETPLPGPSASAPSGAYRDIRDVSLGEGFVWVLAWDLVVNDGQDPRVVDSVLLKIDPLTNQLTDEISFDPAAVSIVAGAGAVWGALGNDGVARFDITSGITEHLDVPGVFEGIAFAEGFVWAVQASAGNVIDIASLDPSTGSVVTSVTLESIGGTSVPVDAAFDASTNHIWVLSEDGHIEEVVLK
jgi:hypothetical protein